ncbi:MAG: hypothetical protein P9L97_06070 [Candidatus Tenebribacter davisii]|nr:hypothetical protein [Candidatus Tenebribacter davisii]
MILNVDVNNATYTAITLDADSYCSHFLIKSRTGSKFFLKEKDEESAPYFTIDVNDWYSQPNTSRKAGEDILLYVLGSISTDTIEVITVLANN